MISIALRLRAVLFCMVLPLCDIVLHPPKRIKILKIYNFWCFFIQLRLINLGLRHFIRKGSSMMNKIDTVFCIFLLVNKKYSKYKSIKGSGLILFLLCIDIKCVLIECYEKMLFCCAFFNTNTT